LGFGNLKTWKGGGAVGGGSGFWGKYTSETNYPIKKAANTTSPVLVVLKNKKTFNFVKSRLKSRLNKQ